MSAAADLTRALQQGVPLRDALADALGDPTVSIAYRLPGTARWVDAEGRSVPDPTPEARRAQTTI